MTGATHEIQADSSASTNGLGGATQRLPMADSGIELCHLVGSPLSPTSPRSPTDLPTGLTACSVLEKMSDLTIVEQQLQLHLTAKPSRTYRTGSSADDEHTTGTPGVVADRHVPEPVTSVEHTQRHMSTRSRLIAQQLNVAVGRQGSAPVLITGSTPCHPAKQPAESMQSHPSPRHPRARTLPSYRRLPPPSHLKVRARLMTCPAPFIPERALYTIVEEDEEKSPRIAAAKSTPATPPGSASKLKTHHHPRHVLVTEL
jgi:hypothetical protein